MPTRSITDQDRPPVTARAVQSVTPIVLGTVFIDITGCSITLTEPGTYRIAYFARGVVTVSNRFVTYELFNSTTSTPLTDTKAINIFANNSGSNSLQATCSMETFIVITQPTTITLQAKASVAGESRSDTSGQTVITANRL